MKKTIKDYLPSSSRIIPGKEHTVISIRVPVALLKNVKKASQKNNWKVADVVRGAMMRFVEEEKAGVK